MKRFAPLFLMAAVAGCGPKPLSVPSPLGPPDTAKPALFAPAPTPVPKPIVLPPIHEETLANGAATLLVENHEIPTVTLMVMWRHGTEADPADKVGLTAMTASLLRQGTKTRSAAKIAEEIDFIGGDLGGSADVDSATLTVQVLKKDLAKGLALLADVAQNPAFPQDEIDDLKRQEVAGVKQVFDDPAELSRQHLRVVVFGEDHPYAYFPSERSLGSITRADLVKHYETWFRPEHAIIGVAGDVTKEELAPQIAKAFGGWKARGSAASVPPPRTPAAKRVVRLVDKDDLTQSSIRLALPGIARKSPDYHAALLMNYVLGGGSFSSRLLRVVRSEEGKTYGIGSGFTIHKHPAIFGISTSTRNAETVPTLDLVFRELQRIRAKGTGVRAEELAAAKANLIGRYPMSFETGDDVLGQVLGAKLHGLPMSEITEYRQKIASVTLEQVDAAAQKYLRPDEMAVVVVGRAADVKGPLEAKFGKVDVVDYLEPTHAVDRTGTSTEKKP